MPLPGILIPKSGMFWHMTYMRRGLYILRQDHPERLRHGPFRVALNERLDEPDPEGAKEGMRAAAPAARKPICLRRPVIRADVEFGNAVPSEAKGRICVNPREFNAN